MATQGINQDLVIDNGNGVNNGSVHVVVTIETGTDDSGPATTEVANLTLEANTELLILGQSSNPNAPGSLIVTGELDDAGLVQVNDAGATLTLNGPVLVEVSGEIEAIKSGATITFSDSTPLTPGPYTVDNFGVIAAVDFGANIFFEQAVVRNEANAEIGSSDLGTVTFDQGSLDNSGTLGAGTIGLITLNQTAVTNETSGLIATEDGGLLTFEQGSLDNLGTVTVDSGLMSFDQTTLKNEHGALMQAENAGTLFIDASGGTITNIGTLAAQNAGIVQLEDLTVDNTGTVELNANAPGSGGLPTFLEITGNVSLDGGGKVTLSDSSDNVIGSDGASAGLLTNVDNTISGAATIGDTGDTLFKLINEQGGTIDASGTNPLIIDNDSPATNNFAANENINSGKIEATGSGGLTIENSTIDNSTFDPNTNTGTDGHIEALSGSHIDLDNATILQGFVTVDAGGTMDTVSGSHNEIETANGPTHNTAVTTISIAGALAISDNSSLTLASPDAIQNTGTIELNSTGDPTTLYFDQGFAGLTGGGHITLSNSTENFISVTHSNDQLTNFDNTISGAGTIGNGGMVLINNAIIDADDSNPLTLDPTSLTNTDLLEATGGGTLVLSHTAVTNTSATIQAIGTGSQVHLLDTTVTGGTMTIGAAAKLTTAGTDFISGGNLTNSGTITNSGNLTLSSERLTNSAGGVITEGIGTTLTVTNTTVAGAGSITIGGTALLSGTDAFSGISPTNTGSITNTGSVTDSGAVSLTDETVTNTGGTFTVLTGDTLNLTDTNFNGGTLIVQSGATLNLDDAHINGVILSDAGATVHVTGDSSIDSVSKIISGNVAVDAGKTLIIDDLLLIATVTNHGTVKVDSGSTSDFGDTGSITGGSLVNLGTIVVHDFITSPVVASTFTLDNVQFTNSGSLTVGDGSTDDALTLTGTTVTGSGSIAVEPAAMLVLTGTDLITGGSLTNTGTVSETGTGNVTFSSEHVSNAGTITEASGGHLTLSGTTVSGAGSVTVGGTAVLTGTDLITGGSLTNTGTVSEPAPATSPSPASMHNAGTITEASGGLLTLSGTTVSGAGSVTVGGTAVLTGTDLITGGSLTNTGTVSETGTGNVTFSSEHVSNAGTITEASGGHADAVGHHGIGRRLGHGGRHGGADRDRSDHRRLTDQYRHGERDRHRQRHLLQRACQQCRHHHRGVGRTADAVGHHGIGRRLGHGGRHGGADRDRSDHRRLTDQYRHGERDRHRQRHLLQRACQQCRHHHRGVGRTADAVGHHGIGRRLGHGGRHGGADRDRSDHRRLTDQYRHGERDRHRQRHLLQRACQQCRHHHRGVGRTC